MKGKYSNVIIQNYIVWKLECRRLKTRKVNIYCFFRLLNIIIIIIVNKSNTINYYQTQACCPPKKFLASSVQNNLCVSSLSCHSGALGPHALLLYILIADYDVGVYYKFVHIIPACFRLRAQTNNVKRNSQ